MPEEPSRLGTFTWIAAGLSLMLFSTAFTAPAWVPKAALLLVIGAVGLTGLLAIWRVDRTTAAAGGAFVAIAGAATALSPHPQTAFFGVYPLGTGLLFVASLVGAWALGRQATPLDRRRLENVLLAAAAVNVAVAVAQVSFDLSAFGLGLIARRPPGLMGNPVQFTAVAVGACALASRRFLDSRTWQMGAALLMTGVGLQISGSRFGLLLAAGAAVVVALWKQTRTAVLASALLAVGLAAPLVVSQATHVATPVEDGGSEPDPLSSAARVEAGVVESGSLARLESWRISLAAVADRPLLGSGPGRFLAATSPHRTAKLARIAPSGYYADGHNIVIEYLVTTGLFGASALAVFLALAWRRARGPLAWFAAGVLAMHLVQPQYVATTPLALLALGAAGSVLAPQPGRRRLLTGAGATAGVVSAALFLAGDARLHEAQLAYSIPAVESAIRTLPAWPPAKEVIATMYTFRWAEERDDSLFDEAIRQQRSAVSRDPFDPRPWTRLGAMELRAGRLDQAEQAFLSALERDPWSFNANVGVARIALLRGDRSRALTYLHRAQEVEDGDAVRELLDSASS